MITDEDLAAMSERYEVVVYTLRDRTGLHTGRPLYRVTCRLCLRNLHEATTNPEHYAERHRGWCAFRLRAALATIRDAAATYAGQGGTAGCIYDAARSALGEEVDRG